MNGMRLLMEGQRDISWDEYGKGHRSPTLGRHGLGMLMSALQQYDRDLTLLLQGRRVPDDNLVREKISDKVI